MKYQIKNILSISTKLFYLTFIFLLIVKCDKEVSRSPVEPPPAQGFIYVQSSPSGFTIFQNDKNTGRITPDSLRYLESGTYQITLKRNYYKDTSVVVNLVEETLSVVNVDYLSNPSMYGKLSLSTQPSGASIILNDSSINLATPQIIQSLLPGNYNVKYKLFNYRDGNIDLIVRSDQTTTSNTSLRDTSQWIDYQVFNSGIQSNSLSAIAIDNNNVKWIGTLDVGLIKYDEIQFTNYKTSNSPIPSNQVRTISIAPNNDVWVGTNNGLAVFNGFSWIIYNQLNSDIPTDLVNSIEFDNMNAAWVGTSGGLSRFDGISWKTFNDSQLRIWVNDFKIAGDNSIWIGTSEAGVVALVDSQFIYYPDSIYNYPTNRISSVDIDQIGNIWFCHLPDSGQRSGVSTFDGSIFTNRFVGNFDNNINHIFIDNQDYKWISTTEGFFELDPFNISTFYTTLNSLISSSQTNSSFRDINGAVWITTFGGGLNKFKP